MEFPERNIGKHQQQVTFKKNSFELISLISHPWNRNFTIKSRTAILRRITGYEEVLELWLGMSLNYYYLTSKDYLAIILDNLYGKIKEAALILVQNYGTSL